MRSNKKSKKTLKNKHSRNSNDKDIREYRNKKTNKSKKNISKKVKTNNIDNNHKNNRGITKQPKKGSLLNKIFLIAYAIFSIYVICCYFKWMGLIRPMMKNINSVIVDSNGNILETIGAERKNNNVDISQIPNNLKNAYVDIEDERFYSHKGVDIKRTTAAIGSYVAHRGKSSFGGSTITQQLVKNLTGNDDNSIARKMEEWYRAAEIESFCSKDEILESYFNIIYVAPNTYGVSAGARYYFDKDACNLDLAECCFLAGINHSPNSYNPFSDKDNSQKIKSRSKVVLNKMLELGHISNSEYNQAIQELDKGLDFKNGTVETNSNGVYSYHADAVISEVIEDVVEKKGIDKRFATNYVYMAGLKIYSTENSEIQKKLEEEYEKSKYVITSSKTGNKSQSAMVVIDNTNGYVVGCVGGLGEKSTSRGFNRATQAYRQTGSASKPLAVIIPGIAEKIFTGATMYVDEPTTFYDGTEEGYSPTNNDKYIGNITVRRAVESSQNIPFVKMMEQVTPKKSIKYLEKMGITSLQEEDESLMLALGGIKKGITPLEMAGAYAAIANDGEYIEPTFYIKVENDKGKSVIKTSQKKKNVYSEDVAYITKQLLKQPVEGANGTARACKIEGMDVAAKTGTTNSNYDKWLCGFTTYYTAVTWYGYDIGETVEYNGKSPAVLLWSTVMKDIHSDLPKTEFAQDTSVKKALICPKTGMTATSACSNAYTEYFLTDTVPNQCTSCTGGNKTSAPTKSQNSSKNNTTNSTKNNSQSNKVNNITQNNKTNSTENTQTNNMAKPQNNNQQTNTSNQIDGEETNDPNNNNTNNNNIVDNGDTNNNETNSNETSPDEELNEEDQDDGP